MNGMRERLTRILIIIIVALLIISLAKVLTDWQSKQKVAGESLKVPTAPVKEKIEDLGEDILGKAVEVLPGAPRMEKVDQDNQVNQETEPIEEPVKNVEKQTEILIETIKELPQEQVEAIKKQIYKEFCEGLLGEE